MENNKKSFVKKATITSLILASTLVLSSCNKQVLDLNYKYSTAVKINGDNALIYELKSWRDYEDGEQLQLGLLDGNYVLVNSFNTDLLVEGDNAEEYARSLIGEEGNISYYTENGIVKTKTR